MVASLARLSRQARAAGDSARAARLAVRALAIDPDATALLPSVLPDWAPATPADAVVVARHLAAYARRVPGHAALALLASHHAYRAGCRRRAALWLIRHLAADPASAVGWADLAGRRAAAGGSEGAKDARHAYLWACRLAPARAAWACNLGAVLLRLDADRAAYRALIRAVALAPGDAEPLVNLATAAVRLGRVPDSAALSRRALDLDPASAVAARNLSAILLECEYRADLSDAARLHLARAWGASIVSITGGPRLRPRPAALGRRRLRIGYLSADLCRHTVGLLVKDVLAAHDREAVEVFAYSAGSLRDDVTARIRAVTTFRDVAALDDAALAARIAGDRIDVLVDLSGHTAGSRIAVLARRAAPVQVSWLGYAATTGLAEIDAVLLDDLHAPPGTEAQFVEPVLRLPVGRHCYVPAPWAPPVANPPVLARGRPTFGSFNNAAKLSPDVLALWGRLLARVPGARLVLKCASFDDPAARRAVRALVGAAGPVADRVELRRPSSHPAMLGEYGDIDVALDPFPFTGCMTSLEAMWMGVPVVTLAGSRPLGRQTLAFLSVLGLPDLIARDDEDYLRIAAALAADRSRLAALRGSLRRRLRASPLCDVAGFTRSLEDALRTVARRVSAAAS